MSVHFSFEEILDMAVQLERNGADFYRRAEKEMNDQKIRQLLLELASLEDEHKKIFENMRNNLTEQERGSNLFDPDNQTSLYLQAFVDGRIFNVRENPAERLTGKESREDILRTAISLEKDSIIFYLGMKEVTAREWGREKIDDILREEMHHITQLNSKLADPKPAKV